MNKSNVKSDTEINILISVVCVFVMYIFILRKIYSPNTKFHSIISHFEGILQSTVPIEITLPELDQHTRLLSKSIPMPRIVADVADGLGYSLE